MKSKKMLKLEKQLDKVKINGILLKEICFRCMGTGKEYEHYSGGDSWLDGDMFGFDTRIYKGICKICKGTGKYNPYKKQK